MTGFQRQIGPVTGLVGVERLDDQLDLGADVQVGDAVPLRDLAEHDQTLGELDGGERERLEGSVRGTYGGGGWYCASV